jgi:hypothetical protein
MAISVVLVCRTFMKALFASAGIADAGYIDIAGSRTHATSGTPAITRLC